MVAEDEGLILLHLRQVLRQQEARMVGLAQSGPEAVELVLGTRPELVLMDIQMPGDFDGLEAARRILAQYRPCLVLLSGYSDPSLPPRARDLGASGFLTKPIDSQALVPALEAALQQHGQTQRL